MNKISQQDEFEVLHALWNRTHKYSFERVTVEGSASPDSLNKMGVHEMDVPLKVSY